MYFKSRADAGRQLAEKLKQYANQNCAVVALSEGGLIVGAQIAIKLHAGLSLLMTERITIPGEPEAIGAMGSTGTFTYNNLFSAGQLEEFTSEYREYIEEERLRKFHRLNQLVGKEGEIDRELLKRHVVILVSDGFNNALSLDIAADFIKPITVKKLVVATPIASITAVDRMHLLADEVYCLGVPENYMTTNHYYDENKLPDHKGLMKIIKDASLIWSS